MPGSGEMWCPSPKEEELMERNKTLWEALVFAASVIKSGLPWTQDCEDIIEKALK